MLKVEIWPAFLNKCLFEIKEVESGYRLFLTKDAVSELKDKGKIWIENIPEGKDAEKALEMAVQILTHPTPDNRILLDGVSASVTLGEMKGKFRSPAEGTPEQAFVAQLFSLARISITDPDCHDYLELLGQYFFEVCPIVAFPEKPYRLKIYGGVSTDFEDILIREAETLKSQPMGILDLSNFHSIGRKMDPIIRGMLECENIAVYANKWAGLYLEELGCESNRIHIGRPYS